MLYAQFLYLISVGKNAAKLLWCLFVCLFLCFHITNFYFYFLIHLILAHLGAFVVCMLCLVELSARICCHQVRLLFKSNLFGYLGAS